MKSIAFCCSAAAAVALLISLAAIPSGCYAGEPQSPNSFPTAAQDPLPNGYSTFALAPAGMKPPKVRKPPYLPLSLECPGLHDGTGLIARNNLCGDLNQGLIPRNPMGQSALGQPYPFELLKNKTLQFLSRTLPYLKEEIESIPKVARFVKPSEFFEKNQSSRRYARSIASSSSSSSVVGDPSGQDLSSERSSALLNGTLAKTAVGTAAKASPISVGGGGGGGEVKGIPEVKEVNITKLSRQQLCEGNVLCQALESLREDGLLSKSFLSNVVSAVGNVASGGGGGGTGSTGSSTGALSSLLEQLTFPSAAADNSSKSGAGSSLAANRNKLATLMTLSQLLPSLTSSSSSSSASDSNGGTPTSGDGSSSSSSSNAYSPLLSIIDYLQSLQSPKTSSSYYSGGATKRKSTVDQQPTEPEFNLQSGGTGPDPSAQTPCASKEEYISPTYARNYQGVWKYVVQIPNEGYFTQTVQQTTCLKTRCDLVEGGACRESPRWVSLLVAEIFYPNVYFPVNQLMPMLYQKQQQQQQQQQQNQQAAAASQPAPTSYHPHHHPQQLSQSSAASQSSLHHQYQVLNSNHHSSQQIKRQQTGGGGGHAYLRPGAQQIPQLNQLTKAELAALVNMLKRSDNGQQVQQQPSHPGLANVELLARRARVAKLSEAETKAVPSSEEVLGDSLSSSGDSSTLSSKGGGGEAAGGGQQQQQHCDGYDKIGCYVVRVYYDWFLVNGSCKCWKATGSGGHGSGLNINETIKRIFIGKWKKK